jgi:carbamoylphosphate synthase large subunit
MKSVGEVMGGGRSFKRAQSYTIIEIKETVLGADGKGYTSTDKLLIN